MNKEDGIYGFPLRFGEDVAVCDAVKIGGFELDPRIRRGNFVEHCERGQMESEEFDWGDRGAL
jgi:hypothetical protein